MPRDQRQRSESGIYHIVMRGINRAVIFKDEEDYSVFLRYVEKAKAEAKFQLYAYCLMSNHIHLLLKEGEEELGIAFRRIGAGFVGWYNRKYERCGHLFQDRFRSEPVESEQYLFTVLRYIHQNPVKAGVAKSVHEYPWSSICEYCSVSKLCNTAEALKWYENLDPCKSIEDFLRSQEYESSIKDWNNTNWTYQKTLESYEFLRTATPWEQREQLSEQDRFEWMKILIKMEAPIAKIVQLTEINRCFVEKSVAGIGKREEKY